MQLDRPVFVGPFRSSEALQRDIDDLFRATNLRFIPAAAFRPDVDFVLRTIHTSKDVWTALPAGLARRLDKPAFTSELLYDLDDEWGPPIGYTITEVVQRADGLRRGAVIRQHHDRTVHPENGCWHGAVEELQRRAGDAAAPTTSLAYYRWGETLGDDFLDKFLHWILAGDVEIWRDTGGRYELQGTIDRAGYRAELDPDDGQRLASAFEARTGRPLSALHRPDAIVFDDHVHRRP